MDRMIDMHNISIIINTNSIESGGTIDRGFMLPISTMLYV